MGDLRAFAGPNAGYVLELYENYQSNPASVDAGWQAFFADFDPSTITLPTRVAAGAPAAQPAPAAAAVAGADLQKIIAVAKLAQRIRDYGHLGSRLDPLGTPPIDAPELRLDTYDLTEADLLALPAEAVGGTAANGAANAAEAIAYLRTIYCGFLGYEFLHVPTLEQRAWLREQVEAQTFAGQMEPEHQRAILRRLTAVEVFERFLHQTYLGQKRFSVEGGDIVVPMLDELVRRAASDGIKQVVIGMAHRGRLNVLTHVLRKRYADFIAQFEGKKLRPTTTAESDPGEEWTGDVKYHLGARVLPGEAGQLVELPIILAPNPSHLEQVNPVVVGMVRAAQDQLNEPGAPSRDDLRSLGVLIHGDAAFPGQGVVSETLNLAGLSGYTTGGTVHIIINNQIGYTTNYWDSRSTLYASDPAKGYEIPIIHVNADEPEACMSAIRLALAFRNRYSKDVLIDLIGYRRWGHNEGDEPAFTQPKMYEKIGNHPTVREIWANRLVAAGAISQDDADRAVKEKFDELSGVRRSIADGTWEMTLEPAHERVRREVETAINDEQLRAYQTGIHAVPDGFSLSSKLARQWGRRGAPIDSPDTQIDWAHAEALAFAAIVSEGTPIRLTGQDAERGTFSQRHLVLHDPKTGTTTTPLQTLPTATASFAVYNSPLSEAACVGFEYGYTIQSPETLVLWEAQFGDFVNGAQIMIDQFISAAARQVGAGTGTGAAPAARVRRPGTGAFERTARALPAAGGAGQYPGRQLHHLGTVFPPAPPASETAADRPAAAGGDDPEEPAPQSAGVVARFRSHPGHLPPGDRRRGGSWARRSGHPPGAVQRQGDRRSRKLGRTHHGRSGRGGAHRAARTIPEQRHPADGGRVPAPAGNRVGAGRTAQHGRVELHGTAPARTARRSVRHPLRWPPGAR
ncbi:MAG: 2-oxoglutarate dehydrogenase E1 component [Thermomicrobiales bacterium]